MKPQNIENTFKYNSLKVQQKFNQADVILYLKTTIF